MARKSKALGAANKLSQVASKAEILLQKNISKKENYVPNLVCLFSLKKRNLPKIFF